MRSFWPTARPAQQCFDSMRFALQQRFDAAVGAVAHPAGDAEASRFIAQCVAETDALHAAIHANLAGPHAGSPGTMLSSTRNARISKTGEN